MNTKTKDQIENVYCKRNHPNNIEPLAPHELNVHVECWLFFRVEVQQHRVSTSFEQCMLCVFLVFASVRLCVCVHTCDAVHVTQINLFNVIEYLCQKNKWQQKKLHF